MPSPFNLATSVPADTVKSTFDDWNRYHVLPLTDEAKKAGQVEKGGSGERGESGENYPFSNIKSKKRKIPLFLKKRKRGK